MNKLIFPLIYFLAISIQAQDIISTQSGELKITPILHGTLVLEYGDEVFYIDPYGGAEAFEGQKKPDYVIITDIHGDHHNQNTLDALDLKGTRFIVPPAVAQKLPEGHSIFSVINGEERTFGTFSVMAIPMYNLPETADSRHPKGRGNGYVLDFDGTKVYISGDTEDIPEMRALKDIDVAFVCMNLPFTMTVEQAASAVAAFKPGIVYPFHYRGREGLSDVEQFKKLVNEAAPEVEVRLRNWYPEK